MKNKKTFLIGGLLAALLLTVLVGAGSVYAQSSTDMLAHGRGPGGGRGLSLDTIQVAAEALHMTTDELITALQSGKTLEQIATEAGVDYEDVQAAIQQARQTELRDRIQQALDAGTISQEKADWLFEGLDKGFIGGPDGDMFFGGRHGPDQVPAPATQPPATQPTPQSSS